jgi:hypothetical protein
MLNNFCFLILFIFSSPMTQPDIEKILGYNPKKIEYANLMLLNNKDFSNALIKQANEYKPGFFFRAEQDFYWVYNRQANKLYKIYGELQDFDDFINEEQIARKVGYNYKLIHGKKERIVTVNGVEAINAIINRYSYTSERLVYKNREVIKLESNLYLEMNKYFSSSCKIFSSLEVMDNDEANNSDTVAKLDESVFDYNKNIRFLISELQIKWKENQMIDELFLDEVASKCFDAVRHQDIYEFFTPLASLYIKYLIDNKKGRLITKNVGESIDAFVEINQAQYDIYLVVLKTISNVISYEYNPHFYFSYSAGD